MKHPPKFPLYLLRWFCNEDRLEELEGDLYEVFQEIHERNPRFAAMHYWLMVFRSFRFYALKDSKQQILKTMTNFFILLKHHTKLIFRQLWKQKLITGINIFGLSVGLAGFISIYALVRHEISFNRHIPERELVYRLYTEFSGTMSGHNRGIPLAVPGYLKQNSHQDMKVITQFNLENLEAKPDNGRDISFDKLKLIIADSNYFKVFSQYEWMAGNSETALKKPFQVVLTIEQGEKYFGQISPQEMIGKQIIYRDSLKMNVSGITRQLKGNTDFIFTDFISFSTINNSWLKDRMKLSDWESTNSGSQAWIKTNKVIKDIASTGLLAGLNNHMEEVSDDQSYKRMIKLKSLEDLHFDKQLSIFDSRGRSAADFTILSVLSLISIALLLMAIFNFINLSIAKATSKAKEVGIKKVLGSNRTAIFGKFILEGMIITCMSLIVALPLAQGSLSMLSDFFPEEMPKNLFNLHFLQLTIILMLLVGFFSGLYPALRISGISIQNALKSNSRMSFSEKGIPLMRKLLVSFQFVCSQALIIVAIGVFVQLNFLLNKDLGFSADHIMYSATPWSAPLEKAKIFYSELEKISAIKDMTWQDETPASRSYASNLLIYKNGETPVETYVFRKTGDTTWLRFYDIELLAGRNVIPVENSKEIVINKAYLNEMGLQKPAEAVGEVVELNSETKYTIVGVIGDFHNMTLKTEIPPLMFMYSKDNREIGFRVLPEDSENVINQVTDVYRSIFPDDPARIFFMDETIKEFYTSERRMSKLSLLVTVLAILISGMGLFGLISITIIQKTKEVGVRKVLGAGSWSLGKVIAREFIWLIAVALIIAVPLSHFFIEDWLTEFAYRASLGWWIYLAGGIVSIILATLVTGFKVYKAIRSNPIESLRYE